MSDKRRDTYDAWKLAAPPEYEGPDGEPDEEPVFTERETADAVEAMRAKCEAIASDMFGPAISGRGPALIAKRIADAIAALKRPT